MRYAGDLHTHSDNRKGPGREKIIPCSRSPHRLAFLSRTETRTKWKEPSKNETIPWTKAEIHCAPMVLRPTETRRTGGRQRNHMYMWIVGCWMQILKFHTTRASIGEPASFSTEQNLFFFFEGKSTWLLCTCHNYATSNYQSRLAVDGSTGSLVAYVFF